MLDRSRVDRLRTLRGAIEWSYRMLDSSHRQVLDHLGVFEGGADLDAVEAVVPELEPGLDLLDVLFNLVDASLVRVVEGDGAGPRFILLETIRRFALDRLSADGRIENARQRHAQYFYDRAAEWHARSSAAGRGVLGFLDREAANLRAVVDYAPGVVRHPQAYGGDPVPARHVFALLADLARIAKRPALQEAWATRGLSFDDDDPVGEAVLHMNAFHSRSQDERPADADEALSLFRAALRRATPRPGLPRWADLALADALMTAVWCWGAAGAGGIDEARAVAESWQPRPGCDENAARRLALGAAFIVEFFAEDYDLARQHQRETVSLLDDGSTTRGEVIAQRNNLVWLDQVQGRRRSAQEGFRALVSDLRDGDSPLDWIDVAENFADVIGQADPLLFARVLGMSERFRVVEAFADFRATAVDDADVAPIRALVPPEEWALAYSRGSLESMFDLLREMAAVPLVPEHDEASEQSS